MVSGEPAIAGQSAMDLLQAAWDLDDDRYERLLEVEPGWLRRRRNHEVDLIMKPTWVRFDKLLQLHNAVRLHSQPAKYGSYMSRRWKTESYIGERSIIQAVLEDGDDAIDRITKYLWAVAAGN